MPYKFKVGDRVKVARGVGSAATDVRNMIGLNGIVTGHDDDTDARVYPWGVRIEHGAEYWFNARELEAAPAKTRKKRGAK